jgi:hypothetical protein
MNNGETNRDEILTAAANGNASALEFLRVFTRRAQWVDDLRDRDKLDAGGWYEASAFANCEAEWLLCLASNSFFTQYRAQLVPVMVLGLNAWVDSEDPKWKVRSRNEVLAGFANEVFWLVAWLTGGWRTMREVSAKYRDYDVEEAQPNAAAEKGSPRNGNAENLAEVYWCNHCSVERVPNPTILCEKCMSPLTVNQNGKETYGRMGRR